MANTPPPIGAVLDDPFSDQPPAQPIKRATNAPSPPPIGTVEDDPFGESDIQSQPPGDDYTTPLTPIQKPTKLSGLPPLEVEPPHPAQPATPPIGATEENPFISTFMDIPREIGKQYEAANKDFWQNVKGPVKPATWKPFVNKPTEAGGRVLAGANAAGDFLNMAFSPVTGAATSIIGRPIETMTGGKVNKETAGTIASVALPFGAEIAAERGAGVAKTIGEAAQKIFNPVQNIFAPATTEGGRAAAQIGRREVGSAKLAHAKVQNFMKQDYIDASKMTTEQQRQVVKYIESTPTQRRNMMLSPTQARIGDNIATVYEGYKRGIQRVLTPENWPNFIQDYYSHMWQQSPNKVYEAMEKFDLGKQGSARSFKTRKLPTLQDGIDAGLTPKFENPVETVNAYSLQMSRYLGARSWLNTLIRKGMAGYHYPNQAPAGWVKAQGIESQKGPLPPKRGPRGPAQPPGPEEPKGGPPAPIKPGGVPQPRAAAERAYFGPRQIAQPPQSAAGDASLQQFAEAVRRGKAPMGMSSAKDPTDALSPTPYVSHVMRAMSRGRPLPDALNEMVYRYNIDNNNDFYAAWRHWEDNKGTAPPTPTPQMIQNAFDHFKDEYERSDYSKYARLDDTEPPKTEAVKPEAASGEKPKPPTLGHPALDKNVKHKKVSAVKAVDAPGENSYIINPQGRIVQLTETRRDPHANLWNAAKLFKDVNGKPVSQSWTSVLQYSDDKSVSIGVQHPEGGWTEEAKKTALNLLTQAKKSAKEVSVSIGDERYASDEGIKAARKAIREAPLAKEPEAPKAEQPKEQLRGPLLRHAAGLRPTSSPQDSVIRPGQSYAERMNLPLDKELGEPLPDEAVIDPEGKNPPKIIPGTAKTPAQLRPRAVMEGKEEEPVTPGPRQFDEGGAPPELPPPEGTKGGGPKSLPPPKVKKEPGMQPRRYLYMPRDVARVYNNYISAGFERGDTGPLWEGARKASNSMTMAKLGLSGFHLMNEVWEGAVHDIARAYKAASAAPGLAAKGKFGEAGRSLSVAGKALQHAPFSALSTPMRGVKMHRQMLDAIPSNDMDKVIHQAFVRSGGGQGMDAIYKAKESRTFFDALSRGSLKERLQAAANHGIDLGRGIKAKPLSGSASLAADIIQSTAAPLFEHYIPNMKRGAFSLSMEDWLRQHPDASQDDIDKYAVKLQDSIDNRFGEMTFDNLFWHKQMKQTMQILLLSPGWNLGTVREIGGGVADLPKSASDALKGEGITDRTAYNLALGSMVVMLNGAMTYLMTGTQPKDRDFAVYRTGGAEPVFGEPERALIPGYQKDVYGLAANGPVAEMRNKLNPALSAFIDYATNSDYRGMPLNRPNGVEPIDGAEPDPLDDIINRFTPISMSQRGYGSSSKIGPIQRTFGIREAPTYLSAPDEVSALNKKKSAQAWKKRIKSDEHIKERAAQ